MGYAVELIFRDLLQIARYKRLRRNLLERLRPNDETNQHVVSLVVIEAS
jgi:hypothetical protein